MTMAEKTKGSVNSGSKYRFERFRMTEGLKNMVYSKSVPRPGDKKGLAQALAAVADGKPLRRSQSGGAMAAMMRMFPYLPAVLDRAGKGAWRDMWLGMPPVAMTGTALKTMGVGRKKR